MTVVIVTVAIVTVLTVVIVTVVTVEIVTVVTVVIVTVAVVTAVIVSSFSKTTWHLDNRWNVSGNCFEIFAMFSYKMHLPQKMSYCSARGWESKAKVL